MKTYPLLSVWYKSFFNHLYYINEKYPKKEDRPLALEYVRSFIHHCTGKHRWSKNTRDMCIGQIPEEHVPQVNSPEYLLIHSMLFSDSFEKKFLACSSDAGTAMCECFHSLSLMYAPKRLSCSKPYYDKKMKCSVMHHNSLVYAEMVGDRQEIGHVLVPRKGRITHCVKRKMSKGEQPWRREVLEECWTVREEYEDKRFFKRIGAPEDDHFDDLKLIYDGMLEREEESDEEEDETEDSDNSE
ncbi:hypothetical protein PENTCL1PPCAC_10954, partial [Pristionchus entomophagus]